MIDIPSFLFGYGVGATLALFSVWLTLHTNGKSMRDAYRFLINKVMR